MLRQKTLHAHSPLAGLIEPTPFKSSFLSAIASFFLIAILFVPLVLLVLLTLSEVSAIRLPFLQHPCSQLPQPFLFAAKQEGLESHTELLRETTTERPPHV